MIKYFSLILMCVTSLCAMDASAPLPDGSDETGSSSSSSSIVHSPENEVSDIYLNARTKKILNLEDDVRIDNAPRSLCFDAMPTVQDIKKLAQKFPNIERIDMRYKLKDADEKVDILKALGRFAKLTSLNLSYNSINDDEARVIAENNRGLRRLDLFENSISDDGATAIAMHLKELTYLNLAWNSMYNEGIRAIGDNLINLTHLYLSMNYYTSDSIQSLQKLTNLHTLHIGNGFRSIDEEAINELRSQWKGDAQNLRIDN